MNESIRALDETIKRAYCIGIHYNELMELDIRTFSLCIDGSVYKREQRLNDMKDIGHIVSAKVAQAVWGSRDFKKPIDDIVLRSETLEDISRRKVFETLRKKGLMR